MMLGWLTAIHIFLPELSSAAFSAVSSWRGRARRMPLGFASRAGPLIAVRRCSLRAVGVGCRSAPIGWSTQTPVRQPSGSPLKYLALYHRVLLTAPTGCLISMAGSATMHGNRKRSEAGYPEFVRRFAARASRGFARIRHYDPVKLPAREDLGLCRRLLEGDVALRTRGAGGQQTLRDSPSVTPTRACPIRAGKPQRIVIEEFPEYD